MKVRQRSPETREVRPDREPPREPAHRPAAAEAVLALQKSAGNRAVSSMLAREPDATQLAETVDEKQASSTSVTLSGIGVIPLLSVNMGGGGGGGGSFKAQDISFSSTVGEHSSKLQQALTQGTAMEAEVVLVRGTQTIRVKLKGAMVSSYSVGGGEGQAETWSLNFAEFEQVIQGPERGGEPGE